MMSEIDKLLNRLSSCLQDLDYLVTDLNALKNEMIAYKVKEDLKK